ALTRNDVPNAIKEFELAIAEDPSTPWLRLRLAQLYVRVGKLDQALEQCQQVVEVEPNNLEALGLQGGVLSALGRDQEAIAVYEHVLQIDPSIQEAYLYLGALYGKRGDLDLAVTTLKKLIARNPTSVLGYYYLGRVHAAAGQLDKAEHYYLEALKLSP